MGGFYMQYLESLCRRRGWTDPSYECYRDPAGFTCLVLVNGREYQTDLAYASDTLAQENAAMRAFMVCRNFSVNGGMLARNGIVQGLPANDTGRHRRSRHGLILVGGFGTRLRPLTLTLPKPLVEFGNKPMIVHQIEALVAAGVKDIVLAVNYRPEIMEKFLSEYEEKYDINIEFSVETEPLGTAGPLKLAEKILAKDDSPFFVLNSDVICDYPLTDLLEFHRSHGNEGTIVVTKVEEPSKYGVVVHKPNHPSRIDRFVEKPVEFVGNRINAGMYIFNTSILKRIELRPTSIEQETFPSMVRDNELHSFDLQSFWMDVGQPKDFLSGTCLYLSSLTKKGSKELTPPTESFVHGGNVMIHPSAKIGKNCRIGPNVTIGPDVVVGDGVRLQRCVLLRGSKVKDHAWVKSTIVGWNSSVGRWARLENVTVLGDDVTIGDEIYVNGGSVLPHKSIKANVDVPAIIM
ncbi:nucleotidyl transferase domain-containing protein [Sarocladium implicatum]|nr:nucleotidyl transferase domain-containing protein [Sarocladium implicatum]